jgi:hypothetical protein
VHILTLKTFDSKLFYMFQGFHRLQICSIWTHRTKVMNLLGFEGHFAILFFNLNISQNHWCFSVEMGSTHFKDFRDILFVNFGQVFYFLSILQDAVENWDLDFEFITDLTQFWLGWRGGGDVASRHWPVPIQDWDLISAVGFRSEGRGRSKADCSPAWSFSGGVVLVLDGGEVPTSGDGDEVADGVQQTMALSNPWSAMTCASWGDGERWLEATAASVVVGVLEKLREKAGQGYHSTRQREGRRRDQRRERGDAYPCRNRPRTKADMVAPARKLSSLAARIREERGGERREGAGLYRVEPWWPFTHGMKRGVIAGALPETEREINGRRVMTGGARMSGREGRGWAGWAGPGDLGPGCGPGWAAGSFLYFFLLFSFSFVSDFCFGFLKMLYYSDLKKKSMLTTFALLKSVFKTYKPKV